MIKKNPTYKVTVYHWDEQEQGYLSTFIEYPITCRFNSVRGTFSQANKCTIDLYNLAPSTQKVIFKDALVGDFEQRQWKYIKLEAGWNGALSQVFYGRILQAYTSKTGGQTDVITHIECQPFDIFESFSSHTFEAGTTYKDALKTMAADMENVELNAIGTLEGTFKTQTTYSGNTLDCINALTGGYGFVDNGVLNVLMGNEVLDVPVPLITDANGLLATPIRKDASLTIKMLFEPTLVVGQLMEIRSSIQPQYNGQYKVLGFTHDCIISPTQAGQRITTVELWIAPLLTSTNINTTGEEVTGGDKKTASFKKVKKEEVTEVVASKQTNWSKPCQGRISSNFGIRTLNGKTKMHNGWDFAVPIGTNVQAVADGKVIRVGAASGYGQWVVIDHGKVNGVNVTSEYGHIASWNVSVGQKVTQGQTIAKSGNTGTTTGPHLHLTIREGAFRGKGVYPGKYIQA